MRLALLRRSVGCCAAVRLGRRGYRVLRRVSAGAVGVQVAARALRAELRWYRLNHTTMGARMKMLE